MNARTGRRSRFISLVVAGIMLGSLSLAGAQATWPPPLGKKKIVYLHGPWTNSVVVAHIGKHFLEKMGYSVDLKLIDAAPAYAAMATGTGDFWSVAFLPGQHPLLKKYEDKLDILSMSWLPTPIGLAVPGYVALASIEDLKDPSVKAKLGGRIIGIEPGSGLMLRSERAVKEYGLDYQLVPGSSAAMAAAFKAAYDKNEWVVVGLWSPHALWAKYNVKFLRDPKGVYGKPHRDFHVARRGFREDFPRAATFLYRFTFYGEQLSELMAWIDEGMKPEQVTARFNEENPELVWYWVGDLIPGFPKPTSLQ